MIWNLIGTIGGKVLDIVVKWNDKRSKWQINLTALGCVPARPVFESKSDATQAAKQAFEAFQSDGLDVMDVGSPR